jgi:hypothetical protein
VGVPPPTALQQIGKSSIQHQAVLLFIVAPYAKNSKIEGYRNNRMAGKHGIGG